MTQQHTPGLASAAQSVYDTSCQHTHVKRAAGAARSMVAQGASNATGVELGNGDRTTRRQQEHNAASGKGDSATSAHSNTTPSAASSEARRECARHGESDAIGSQREMSLLTNSWQSTGPLADVAPIAANQSNVVSHQQTQGDSIMSNHESEVANIQPQTSSSHALSATQSKRATSPTPGPWQIAEYETFYAAKVGSKTIATAIESEANARLIAAAPDRHDQILALVAYNWQLEKRSLYDEEGVEGWVWIEPNGREHTEIGPWDELPPWPESARAALAAAKVGAA